MSRHLQTVCEYRANNVLQYYWFESSPIHSLHRHGLQCETKFAAAVCMCICVCVCVAIFIRKKKLGKSLCEMALYFENMHASH